LLGILTPYPSWYASHTKNQTPPLTGAAGYLKADVSFDDLDQLAMAISDNEAAKRLNQERTKLFASIHGRSEHGA
jgi:hypothetical protein